MSREDRTSDEALKETVGLPEILGVPDPALLDTGVTWRKRSMHDLLRVPIGVGGNGGIVLLDLKESAHGGMGPHGMVVGATGSGKSEMLRTLVASLVIGHGPDRLALMLVDFKGGATFAAMADIPRIAGMITNLQDDLTLVDRMRDALFGEMQYRQGLLKQAGNLPNVTSYQDLIDAGHQLEPLPHLLVIIDELSELLAAKPDFAELFVAIGRIGRSIGSTCCSRPRSSRWARSAASSPTCPTGSRSVRSPSRSRVTPSGSLTPTTCLLSPVRVS